MNNLRRFFTLLNLHIAGAVLLAGLVLFLGTKAALAIHAAGAVESESYQQAIIQNMQLQSQMSHLQGLPEKVDQSREDADKFFEKRIAPNYSTIAEELGTAFVKNQVRLTRSQYTPSPSINGLTELRVDANLSGDYSALMRFINDLERDKDHVFFIIDGLTLTGQQGGLVNLRLRLTTYLLANAGDQPPPSEGSPDASKPEGKDAAKTEKISEEVTR
jgi:type IV pilus assembly protein PilO